MNTFKSARILVADDDESFAASVTGLLKFCGYDCDIVPDGHKALECLRATEYDLLVADIGMPGNEQLQLVRSVLRTVPAMSVILATGQPSVTTAVQAFQLPVVAYLEKPITPSEFLAQVGRAIERSRLRRSIDDHRQRMEAWRAQLARIEQSMQATLGLDVSGPRMMFMAGALEHVMSELADLKRFSEAMFQRQQDEKAKHLLEWPQPLILIEAVRETIAVLEKTRSSFKSKELGDLRKKLELLMRAEDTSLAETAPHSNEPGKGRPAPKTKADSVNAKPGNKPLH
jgi:CheY-like chemotaxis protein